MRFRAKYDKHLINRILISKVTQLKKYNYIFLVLSSFIFDFIIMTELDKHNSIIKSN